MATATLHSESAARKLITAERLRELIHYDPETGNFTWKKNRRAGARAGDPAGRWTNLGYLQIKVERAHYYAHRLAWLYVCGVWPAIHLDHINGNKADNRIANLREASSSQNCRNRKMSSANTSGFKGVCRATSGGWRANINHIHLGTFATKEEAAEAYREAAAELHGEFARLE